MIEFDYNILQCPITKEDLIFLNAEESERIIKNYESSHFNIGKIKQGFINKSRLYFYPIIEDIILLLPIYALPLGKQDSRDSMKFDKERVFNYYNEISYSIKNGYKIYKDSPKWVDFRDIASTYIKNSFSRALCYLDQKGKYYLDIASGPIGLEEYIALSQNYDYRICADISINALIQAKLNYSHRKGIYLCSDITNIPLKENSCDAVLCQHTLYHIPKNEQETAVREMYRVAKPNTKIGIVYSLFYHSWFMNIFLFPIQLYRVTRHIAGKVYVRIFNSKPRLYFYPHRLKWFRNKFEFSNQMQIYCWRSTNKYFLNLYIHKWLWGKKLLMKLRQSEEKYPRFWGKIGEYPIIVIKKSSNK